MTNNFETIDKRQTTLRLSTKDKQHHQQVQDNNSNFQHAPIDKHTLHWIDEDFPTFLCVGLSLKQEYSVSNYQLSPCNEQIDPEKSF